LQIAAYANINRSWNRVAHGLIEGCRFFMRMCDKVMQLRKNDWKRADAVCGSDRKPDAKNGPYTRLIGLKPTLNLLIQMAMIDG
jgi:hypothetical protein